ncbi:MAG TPA: glycosyltransferase [Candidatus Hydrogenedentes bacterium]|nr:glycosyltransferase [Candidatus Hydrogenedentota bacterium]
MPTISAVLIVRNEEKHLERCLLSLFGVVDEIVVVDTGSEDNTERIARSYGARIGHFPWVDDFSAARNTALHLAQGDYVLSIDADEWIENGEEAKTLLHRFVQGHGPETVGTVEIVSTVGTAPECQEVVDHTERFFHRVSCRFEGAIHEQIMLFNGSKQTASTGLRLGHSGYAQPTNAPDHKALRNLKILRKEVERLPDDEYCWYQLGKAFFSLKDYEAAIEAFQTALARIRFTEGSVPQGRLGGVSREVLTGALVSLAYALVNTGKPQEAAALLKQHLALGHNGVFWSDFHHARGYVHLMLGNLPESRAAYLESLRLGQDHEDVRGTGSFSSAYHLGLLSEAEDNLPEALKWYTESLRCKCDYPPVLSRCIDLAAEQNIVFPIDLLELADREAFSALYLKRLRHFMENNLTAAASRLIQAAECSPSLHGLCKASLVHSSSHTD